MKIQIIIALLFFSCVNHFGYGQKKKKIDSLEQRLQVQKIDDSLKVKTLMKLIEVYIDNDYRKSLEFSEQALKISEKVGYVDGLISSFYFKGRSLISGGNTDSAIYYLKKSLECARANKIIRRYPQIMNTIGMAYYGGSKYKEALRYYLMAEKANTDVNDTIVNIAILNNIGNLYLTQKDLDLALLYHTKSLELSKKKKEKFRIASSYNNIGLIYRDRKQYEKAIKAFVEANRISKEINMLFGIALTTNNIGSVYKLMKNYKMALEYFNQAAEIRKKMNDRQGLALAYQGIANVYIYLENYNKTIEYGLMCEKICNEERLNNIKMNVYEDLAEAYSRKKDYANAFNYSQLYATYKDTVFNKENKEQMNEMQAKYETEKKEKEIILLNKDKEIKTAEIKKQTLLRNSFIIGFILFVLLAIAVTNRYLLKKKSNIILSRQNEEIKMQKEEIAAQRDEIEKQRDEIAAQRDLVTEQKEHIEEIYQEISDSINYANRIQQAVLPSGEYAKSILGNYFILFKPKDIVSGDFYWSTKIGEMLIVTVADCTGHGVPGAFMSMLGISFLNEIVRKKELTKASEVLDHLRTSVIEALQQKGTSSEQKDGMDIALCAINTTTLEMQFAGANNPCWIVSSMQEALGSQELLANGQQPTANSQLLDRVSELVELKPDKQPIGIYSNMQPFTNQNYQLQKDDIIYLMSDGFEDQFGGPNRKKFLSKNLKNLLTANSQLPIADQKHILETTINEWIGVNEQIDDITVLGIKL